MNDHPDSKWNHPICETCWDDRWPERFPYRLLEPEEERCCWCGKPTTWGAYVRDDPENVPVHNGGVIEVLEWPATT